jgi:carboxypeptidase family protein
VIIRRFVAFAATIATVCLARPASAQQTDVIRGRVTGPDSAALQGVNVKATSYAGNITKTAATDRNGRFTIIFINGEGDYWLDFTKLGFAPRRFEIKKVGDEEVMLADTRMSSVIATLDAVNVIGQPNRALPNRNAAVDVGGGERPLTNAAVAPDQAGNLAAMAATIAGFQLIPGLDGAPDMFSLLGLSGDQNNTTFNGLGSGISALPPDILATTSIRPYTFDPSTGGFSGAQISIQTFPGSNFSRRAMTNADIAPALEWADETAEAQGQKFTNMRLGGNAAGPIATDKAFYNSSYNFGRRFADVQTLLNTSPLGLEAAGVAADSVTRLLGILRNLRVPATVAGAPTLDVRDVIQATTNIDLMPSSSGTGHSFTLGLAGNYQRSQPAAGRTNLLLTTPAHNGETEFWGANAALVHSNYFWFGILEKTTLGFAESGNSTEPYLRLPQGSVRVSSALPDGSSAVKSLSFGGNPQLMSLNNRTIQLNNQLSWYSADNHHTLKLSSGITRDEFTNDVSANLLGSFAFNSLADLEGGKPSSFARTLAKNTQSGSQLSGTLALGDYWRPTPSVQLQYGVRVDANSFLSAPAFNKTLLDTLGVRNDVVPNRAYVSPRIGVQWYYGTAPQVSYAPGSARPPRAVIHAGVGIFQNIAGAQLISPSVNSTGLANSTQTISCVGAAVPFPDWNAFLAGESAVPTRCADGSVGTVFSTTAPGVSLFDARYRQPQSLRAAGDWSSPVLDNRFVLGVQAIASWGLNQQGSVDINFNPAVRFSLASEGGRPVFANAGAIVPTTGAIAIRDTRVSPAFQRVTVQRSDLRVDSHQLTVNLKPVTANARLKWDLTYTLLDSREKFYGFTSTVGNPFDTYWAPLLQGGRHTVTLGWSDFPVFDIVFVSVALRFMSGPRYTPMIGGDVNGDGYLNDRAYVFRPTSAADSATAAAMRSLLATGESSARDCLVKQLDQLAARGSCQAPWTTTGGLQVKFNPTKIGLPKRLSIILNVQNPLGLADLALHGSNDLRGWGQNIPPDQNLLFVRGFDPATQRFKYDVNQRFGSTRPQQASTRVLPYISLTMGLDIGAPRERQLLTQRLDIGRDRPGNKQRAESLKQLGSSSIPNPMSMILQQQDSLKLTRTQADSLAWLSREFAVYADSVWTPVSNYLEGLPDHFSHGEAYDRYVSARERTVDYLLTLVPDVKKILTASQRRKLPIQISNYLDERVLRFLRSSSAGDNSSVIIR